MTDNGGVDSPWVSAAHTHRPPRYGPGRRLVPRRSRAQSSLHFRRAPARAKEHAGKLSSAGHDRSFPPGIAIKQAQQFAGHLVIAVKLGLARSSFFESRQ